MTAAAPALAASSTPSRNGKNASDATTDPASGARAFDDRDADRIDARHLAGADAQRAAAGDEHDRVRLDVLADAPREVEVAQLLGRRRRASTRPCAAAAAAVSRSRVCTRKPPATLRSSSAPGALGRDVADQQAQVLARREHRQRVRLERRRDHALEERLLDLARQLAVDGAVDGDDAAERRHRIGLARAPVGVRDALVRDGRAARVVVLDDRRGRRGELGADPQRRVEVEQVVVGQLLALQHLRARQRRAGARPVERVERRLLVRVLAVAQRARQRAADVQRLGEVGGRRVGRREPAEVRRDRAVVGGRVRERLARQTEAGGRQRSRRPRRSPRARAA